MAPEKLFGEGGAGECGAERQVPEVQPGEVVGEIAVLSAGLRTATVVATAPLLAMPFAYWLEGDRPSRRAVTGGVIAVAGCIALTLAR